MELCEGTGVHTREWVILRVEVRGARARAHFGRSTRRNRVAGKQGAAVRRDVRSRGCVGLPRVY